MRKVLFNKTSVMVDHESELKNLLVGKNLTDLSIVKEEFEDDEGDTYDNSIVILNFNGVKLFCETSDPDISYVECYVEEHS